MKSEKDTVKEIIQLLDESAASLDTKITGQLANSRNEAVAVLVARTRTASAGEGAGVVRLFSDYIHHHRLLTSTVLVCSAVFIAFLTTQQLTSRDTMDQGDAFLLGSELPPEAYLDKGFDAWLEQTSQQQQ